MPMISKNKIKRLVSLQQKKYRQIHNLFVVEGIKQVNELLLSNFNVVQVVATSENRNKLTTDIIEVVSVDEMKKISSYKTPPGAIAVVEINQNPTISINAISKLLVLDDIADPGNLGTLIRSADWFGFDAVICSSNTVDCYNSKVIQSTMGSIFRIPILYKELIPFFKSELPENVNTYAAVMVGSDYRKEDLKSGGVLIIGNESNGISSEILQLSKKLITIPRSGDAESLNAGVAGGILMSAF